MTASLESPSKGALTPSALGAAIRAARKHAGLRLEDAALHLGLAKQTLQNLETGHAGVAVGTALHVAASLGVRVVLVEPPHADVKRP